MNLRSLLRKYLTKDKTGQLVVKFSGEEHLCKISIADGNAVYIALGKKTPYETLDHVKDKEIEDANFLEGVAITKRVNGSLNEKLLKLANTNGRNGQSGIKVNGKVSASSVENTVHEFINILGPLGALVSDRVLSDLMYEMGSPMDGEDYSCLVGALIDEVPTERKEEFKNRVSRN